MSHNRVDWHSVVQRWKAKRHENSRYKGEFSEEEKTRAIQRCWAVKHQREFRRGPGDPVTVRSRQRCSQHARKGVPVTLPHVSFVDEAPA